jgi:lipoate-protein ligase B
MQEKLFPGSVRFSCRAGEAGLRTWKVLDIPFMDYDEARALQLALVEAKRRDAGFPEVVMLLEHPPVLTVGRRGDLSGLRVPVDFLKNKAVGLRVVERGGLITYHGPGQLVCYPVVQLRANGWKVVDFVSALEEVMIRTALCLGIQARRSPLNRGVWAGSRKLGSLGIAVRGGVCFHGLALNVNTDLEPFSWIDPCGLAGIGVTSLAELLGARLDMARVRWAMRGALEEVFRVVLREVHLSQIHSLLASAQEGGAAAKGNIG